MRALCVRLVVQLMIGSLIGCTTYEPVRDLSYMGLARQVRDGDRVLVTFKDGSKLGLKKVAVVGDGLTGQASDGTRRRVRFSEVSEIAVRNVDPGPTTLIVLAIAAAAALAVIFIHGLQSGE
jgi:hypothetical protein